MTRAVGILPVVLLFGMVPIAAQSSAPSDLRAFVAGHFVTLTWKGTTAATRYQVEAGTAAGLSDIGTVPVGSTNVFGLPGVPAGSYTVRVRAVSGNTAGLTSNEIVVAVGSCAAPPPAPARLTAVANNLSVGLAWSGPSGATSYRVQAGSTPGASNLFNRDIGLIEELNTIAAPGTYYVRVRAANACGASPASNEVVVTTEASPSPKGLNAAVRGSAVSLRWAPAIVSPVASNVLEAGSAPGLADVGTFPVGPVAAINVPTVAPGTYYLRVRAAASGSLSVPSNELAIRVGTPAPAGTAITFASLVNPGGLFESHTESGFDVVALSAAWQGITTHGQPAPFVQFVRPLGYPNASGDLQVTAGGSPFTFRTVDLYSSVTPIPWVFTGIRNGTTVFTVGGMAPMTLGNFATVPNPRPDEVIDTLIIRLFNPSVACCSNPVGLDNIVLVR